MQDLVTSDTNTDLVNKILDLPEAPVLINQLNEAWKEEQKKRIEFYNDISEMHKSEFINGEIIIHSPVIKEHNDANGNLYKILDTYVVDNDLGFVGIEKIMIQLTRNDYEPDLCFFKKDRAQHFERKQKFFPAPDLVIEVLSDGTAYKDRGIKFDDYEQHGVTEYWLINADDEIVEQYRLKNSKYELVLKSGSGNITCVAIPNLTIPIPVIFDKRLTNEFVKQL